MKKPFLILLLATLSSVGAANAASAANMFESKEQAANIKKWTTCQTASDCEVIQGPCEKACVNRKYAYDAGDYYHELGAKVSCPAPRDRGAIQPVCRKNYCTCAYANDVPDSVTTGPKDDSNRALVS